ncbi:MAG: alkaline phosphatase family protein, partial [Limisphaerales bacterium]
MVFCMPARNLLTLVAAILAFASPLRHLNATGTTNDHVILITIDGMAAYYLSDPRASLPTLRKLAAEGAAAQALRVVNPTTTWPNHTTLITGVYPQKHSVLFNGLMVRDGPGRPVRIEPDCTQHDLIAVPTLFDRLHQAGGRTAAINWPCTRGSETLDDNWPDAPDRIQRTTPRLRAELVRDGILEDLHDASFADKSAAAQDQAWTAAALHVLEVRPPRLLLLHLLATDAIQHRYGPQSAAAYIALALADAHVAEVLGAVRNGPLRDRTTVVIASDHGFARPLKLINPNVILRKAGLLRPGPRRRAQSASEGGTAFVYLTNPATGAEDREKVIALLQNVEGIAEIIRPEHFGELHLPDPDSNRQIGDLLLTAKEGYVFSDEYLEDDPITPLPISLGSHGYLATDSRMNGVLLLWGPRIKPGMKLGMVDSVDVAPTLGALLGLEL